MSAAQKLTIVCLWIGCLAATESVAADLTVSGALHVTNVIGTTSSSLEVGDTFGFRFEVENATFERVTDSSDLQKFTKVNGNFDITFTGAAASELNGQAGNWTRGLLDGDSLMWVRDIGSGNFETYIYLLPDDTEQFIYWQLRFNHSGGYDLDPDGFPIISDTSLTGARTLFFDFRGTNSGNIVGSEGTVRVNTPAGLPPGSLQVSSEVEVSQVIGSTSLSLGVNDRYAFFLEITNPNFERKIDTSDSLKLTKVDGDFDIVFTGDSASELNGQAANWTRGMVDGDSLMWVKDKGFAGFETYIYLLPDDTEQHVYWQLRFNHDGGYSVDAEGFPIIGDHALGNGRTLFFDFRGTNAGNVSAQDGAVSITTVPEPTQREIGAAVLVAIGAIVDRKRRLQHPVPNAATIRN